MSKRRIKSDTSLLEDLIRKGYTAEEAQKILDQAPQATNQSKRFKFKSPLFQEAELEVDDFIEEVNETVLDEDDELSQFASDEALTTEEVVDALKVIDSLAEAVVEAQGEESPELSQEEVLDIINDTLVDEDLPEDITNAVLDISVVTDGTHEGVDATIETVEDTTIVHGVDDTEDVFEEVQYTDELQVAGSVVFTNTKNPDTCPIKSSYKRINSHWKDKNMYTRLAWDHAEKKVTEMLGHAPETPKEWATVAAIAKNKYRALEIADEEAYKEAAFASARRVIFALKQSLKAIKSNTDTIDTVETTQTTVEETDGEGSNVIEDIGLLGSDPENVSEDGNVEGGSEEVVLDFSDIDFENGPVFEMELPLGEDKQKLQFEEVAAGVAVLKGRKRDFSPLYNKVYKHKNGTATVFLKSNIWGLVAVNGRFIQGIKNSVYDVFVRVSNTKAVNSSAKAITLVGKEKYIISSAASNRSISNYASRQDVVARLESAYVSQLSRILSYTRKVHRKDKALRQSMVRKHLNETQALRSQLESDNASFQARLDEQRFAQQLAQQHQAIQSSLTSENKNRNKNIDFLTKLMK